MARGKVCVVCGVAKTYKQFHKGRNSIGGQQHCSECPKPSLDPHDQQAKLIERMYGISAEEYARLELSGCAICGQQCSTGRRLAVDHDHSCCPGERSCGKCVRGLLCWKHNAALGMFNDDVEMLLGAVKYLREHRRIELIVLADETA